MNELIINIDDLVHNINVIKSKEKEDYTIIAVVKGNAYGCDLKQYVEILKDMDIDFFAVATYKEAIEFRKYFNDKLLLLTPYFDEEYLNDLIDKDVILTIDSIKQSLLIDKIAKEKNKKVTSHIKIETGLNRYGFKYTNYEEVMNAINNTENIIYEGIYSHFSNSLRENNSFSELQYKRFTDTIDKLKENKIEFEYKHICNSSGYFKYPNMHLNASRIGSAFIGQAVGIKNELKHIGTFHTKVTKVFDIKSGETIGYANSYKASKNMKIAILPVGYFDGIGKTLVDQRFLFKSKVKRILIDIKKLFKQDYYKIGEFNVLGQIGMHDVVLDVTNSDIKINDDIYFNIKPTLIDSSVKRVYKETDKQDIN